MIDGIGHLDFDPDLPSFSADELAAALVDIEVRIADDQARLALLKRVRALATSSAPGAGEFAECLRDRIRDRWPER